MFKKRFTGIIFGILIMIGTLAFSYTNADAAGFNGWRLNNTTWVYYINGNIQSGWIAWGDKWYFLDSTGAMKTGWITDGDYRYYLNQGGDMAIGWKCIDNTWYYFNNNGTIKTGWISWRGKEYYLNSTGSMAVNTKTPDGFTVGADGARVITNNEIFTITVETAQEFVDALGSNKKIILKPGVYNLSGVNQINKSDNSVVWKIVNDGKELNLNNISNLTIEGMDTGKVEIKVTPRYAEIINFTGCSNINIKNIVAGHTPAPYECNAGVLGFNNSNDISIADSELYGCGSVGLDLHYVNRLNVSNCTIDHCSLRAIYIYKSEDITFTGSKIVNHEAYSNIVDLYSAKNVSFSGCEFSGNNKFSWSFIEAANNSNVLLDNCLFQNNAKAVDAKFGNEITFFFKTVEYDGTCNSLITVKNSKFINNKCDYLGDNAASIKFENCVGEGNVWN